MNFLELCQNMARESGISRNMTSVSGQTGRLADVVSWVNQAWRSIQNLHPNWNFMRAPFTVAMTAADGLYLASDCTDVRAGAPISRFGAWINNSLRIYRTSDGASQTTPLPYLEYDEFDLQYQMATVANGRPVCFSVRPYDNALLIGPTPDDAFTVRGEFYRSAGTLTADGDVPEMPAQFHWAIVWRAIELYAINEESAPLIVTARSELSEIMGRLEANQLPEITFGAPLVP